MEGAAPLLAAAIILPIMLGGIGLMQLCKQRLLGMLLVSASAAVLVLVGLFALG